MADQSYRNISSATSSNMSANVKDIDVSRRDTDAASGTGETEWFNPDWTKYFGYYKSIPELKIAIDTRATWTLGKGYKADPETTAILDHISGYGHDTFNSILKNMIVTRRINGDAYAEIIRDEKTGILLNLKPISPGSLKIIFDEKGVIKHYIQFKGEKEIKFSKKEIFHLVNKRVGDEMHGVSDIECCSDIIQANYESFMDMKKLMHRHVKPIHAFKMDTDNQAKIDAFVTKMDQVINKGENIYIPKDSVEFELVSVPAGSTLNPLPWRQHLKDYFFQVVGIPQIILGNAADFGESSAKIAYLSFQQSVEEEQLDIEEAVWNQLFLRINLEFPATIQNELISDTNKDGAMGGLTPQPSDLTAGVGQE